MTTDGELYERDPEAWNAYLAEGNAKQARKRVSADAIVRDASGRILLVDPTYKPDWDLPGGMAEANEPPSDALRRELREELGLDIRVGDLLCVNWVSPTAPGTTSSTSSSTAEPSTTARSKACISSTANCAPSSSATKAMLKSASAPMSGAGQAPRWKRWGPAGHGICRTGTPKAAQEPMYLGYTSRIPALYLARICHHIDPPTTARMRRDSAEEPTEIQLRADCTVTGLSLTLPCGRRRCTTQGAKQGSAWRSSQCPALDRRRSRSCRPRYRRSWNDGLVGLGRHNRVSVSV